MARSYCSVVLVPLLQLRYFATELVGDLDFVITPLLDAPLIDSTLIVPGQRRLFRRIDPDNSFVAELSQQERLLDNGLG